jgi:uncharacterized repeat protein (TIGR03803 family)
MSNGAEPTGGLAQDDQGNFYGTTRTGGTNADHHGTIFKMTLSGVLTSLISFDGTNGTGPSGLVRASDGNFYGGTALLYGHGTIFRMTPEGSLTTLVWLNGTNGHFNLEPWPQPFVAGDNDDIYGTTDEGGMSNLGIVFRLTTSGQLTTLYSFAGSDGADPGGLVRSRDGLLYGITRAGGSNGSGTVFKISPNGIFTHLHSFSSPYQGTNSDGTRPSSSLVEGVDGNFYGSTTGGGTNGAGTIFRITPNGVLTPLYSFGTVRMPNGHAFDGSQPNPLVQARDGNFYGTTYFGGASNNIANYGDGTVFRLSVPIRPTIRSIARMNDALIISWNSVAGQEYQVQATSSVDLPGWNNRGGIIVATNGVTTFFDAFGSEFRRFYRIVLLP